MEQTNTDPGSSSNLSIRLERIEDEDEEPMHTLVIGSADGNSTTRVSLEDMDNPGAQVRCFRAALETGTGHQHIWNGGLTVTIAAQRLSITLSMVDYLLEWQHASFTSRDAQLLKEVLDQIPRTDGKMP